MDPVSLILGLSGLFGGLFGNKGSSSTPTTTTTDPNISAMLADQQKRMAMQGPLYEAVTRLAMGLMPTKYQQPLSGTYAPPAIGAVPMPWIPSSPNTGSGQGGPSGPPSWSSPDALRAGYSDRRQPPRTT